MLESVIFYSPLGAIRIAAEADCIVRLDFVKAAEHAPVWNIANSLLAAAQAQLAEYFAGKRRQFDLPLNPKGTEFQKKVWQALQTIPYGETRTYKDIAEAVGAPKGFRAVGMANHNNPIAIIIPCHRVIGSNGLLTGYAGGLEYKRALLSLERGLPMYIEQKPLTLI